MTHRKTERTTPQHSCSSPRRLHKWQVGRCRSLLPPSPLPPPRALNTCPEIGSSVELAGRANANTEEERREKGRERGPLVPYANCECGRPAPIVVVRTRKRRSAAARSESSQPLETFFQEVGEDSAPRRERPSQTEERTETEGGSGLCSALFARLLSAAARIFEL